LQFATTTEVKAQAEAAKVISPLTLASLVPALGLANLKQFMNAAGTAPEYAKGLKIGTFTKFMDDASGSVSYSSIGFKPSSIILISAGNTNLCVGFDDAVNHFSGIVYNASAAYYANPSVSIYLFDSGTNGQTGYVSSFDTDGFTIAYTYTGGSAHNEGRIFYMAIR
jgi:hypothetical protein